MLIKYVRISTKEQKTDRQKINQKKFDLIIEDTCSGSVRFADRPGGKEILNLIQQNKIKEIHISEISRLGRNFYDIFKALQLFNDNHINLQIENLNLGSMVDNKPNPIFKMILGILANIAEQERETHLLRINAGIAVAKSKGRILGRHRGTSENKENFLKKPKIKQIIYYLDKNYLISEITKILKCSSATINKVKKIYYEK